jgi:hypothetical protein
VPLRSVPVLIAAIILLTAGGPEEEPLPFLTMWGSPGGDEGECDVPAGLAVEGAGNVCVADIGSSTADGHSPTI